MLHFPHRFYLVLRKKIPLNVTNLLVFRTAIQCVSCEVEKGTFNVSYTNYAEHVPMCYDVIKETKDKTSVEAQLTFPFNPLKAQLNPICHLLALLGSHHILHVSRIRVKLPNYCIYD